MGGKAVLASVKVRNLKANHSPQMVELLRLKAVLASVKVRNLKANHSTKRQVSKGKIAVLASVKVRNLKANHSTGDYKLPQWVGCISKCEGTKSES